MVRFLNNLANGLIVSGFVALLWSLAYLAYSYANGITSMMGILG